ncbi:hypothetical protein GN244_ATG16337 [Phytophthora infestans]|uniref:SWIM-type domain-containing protein n=1 Tax=Phytophthora infestans TaxID=4787 RepID=A0A833W7I8_PHYIN|nr:hypothetical protein GN244_ATG16337 [Phytophthora infestans]
MAVLRTSSGFAAANNPVDTFNAAIKRPTHLTYANEDELSRCCKHESLFGDIFAGNGTFPPPPQIRRRVTELRRSELIEKMPPSSSSNKNPAVCEFVLVRVRLTPRIYVRPRKKTIDVMSACAQMGVNNARMKREGQPETIWAVNVREGSCPCKYYFKHSECVHLYVALLTRYGPDRPPSRPMFNICQRKRKRGLAEETADAVASQQPLRGRPILNGPALSLV